MNSIKNYFERTTIKEDIVQTKLDGKTITSTHSAEPSTSTSISSSAGGNTGNEATVDNNQVEIGCLCLRCHGESTEPFQPIDKAVLISTTRTTGTGKQKRPRTFQEKWYNEYQWLELCTFRNSAFCFYCSYITKKTMRTLTTKQENAFTEDGFQNWKKAKERFAEHEASQGHSECCMKFRSLGKASVASQLDTQLEENQKTRRSMLLAEISSLRFLLRQGLAIRGHMEENGNLHQLMKLRANDITGLSTWLKEKRYISPQITNELITIMGHDILRRLLVNIRNAAYFSILADETRDMSNKEQMVVCVRWVGKDYKINEDPLGLIEISTTTANNIVHHIRDVLVRCSLPLENCRGQGYDGAAAMSGRLTGVATQIQAQEERALPVHCLAHCLNLSLQDVCQNLVPVRDALDLVKESVKLIRASPRRAAIFTAVKEEQSGRPELCNNLKPLCPTRWTVRTDSIQAVLDNYHELQETLNKITQEGGEAGIKAGGLLSHLEKFSSYFGLKLSYLVFSAGEQLSKTLQTSDLNIQEASEAANMTIKYYERLRKDDEFESFYTKIVDSSKEKTDPPTLQRKRKLPRRFDSAAEAHQFSTPTDLYRQQYFETLDLVREEIQQRFTQKGFVVLREVECLILDAANGRDVVLPVTVSELYAEDINMERLEIQLKMLPDMIKTSNMNSQIPLKNVSKISTICSIMLESDLHKRLFGEVDKLIRIFLTMPVTTATAERTFSVLRRTKSYLRTTMGQERLNNVMMLNIHKEECDTIVPQVIASEFVRASDRRRGYFGSY